MADILKRARSSGRVQCEAGEEIIGAAIVKRDHQRGGSRVELVARTLAAMLGAVGLVVSATGSVVDASRRRDNRRAARVRRELPFGSTFLVLTNRRLIGYSLRRWSEGPGRLIAEWPIASVHELAVTPRGLLVAAGGARYQLSCDKHRGRDQISRAFDLS